jgi:prevent-host-death family protein
MCYAAPIMISISLRDLRNHLSEAVRRVEAGEIMTVTVDRRPVAELVPIRRRRRSVPVAEAMEIVRRHPADRGLLDDLKDAFPDTTDDL